MGKHRTPVTAEPEAFVVGVEFIECPVCRAAAESEGQTTLDEGIHSFGADRFVCEDGHVLYLALAEEVERG